MWYIYIYNKLLDNWQIISLIVIIIFQTVLQDFEILIVILSFQLK